MSVAAALQADARRVRLRGAIGRRGHELALAIGTGDPRVSRRPQSASVNGWLLGCTGNERDDLADGTPHAQVSGESDLCSRTLKDPLGIGYAVAVPQRDDGDLVSHQIEVKSHEPQEVVSMGESLSRCFEGFDQAWQMVVVNVELQDARLCHPSNIVFQVSADQRPWTLFSVSARVPSVPVTSCQAWRRWPTNGEPDRALASCGVLGDRSS